MKPLQNLQECREEIDKLDEEILELLNKRMEVVKTVGKIKQNAKSAIYRPEREKEIIDRLEKKNLHINGLLNKQAIEAIYLEIFAVARNLELPERIAYLGPEGSFTHQAAESRFGAMSSYLSLSSIQSVFTAVEAKRAKFAVVPIENSRDGVVGETLDLLAKSNIKIVAELYMPIHMAFATKAENTADIKRIYSKDKGFGQCREFLLENGLNDVEHIPVDSTAKAAILASQYKQSAAICSHIAAKLYNIPTMFENIEDTLDNTTRFLILSDFKNAISKDDKTSILVKLKDPLKAGALVRFLQDFNDENINLSKIESRPSKEKGKMGYWFFIDFFGHIDDKAVQKVIKKHHKEVVWLGSYAKGDI